MLALMRGMNAVYELQESRNYIMLRLRALVYTVFFMIAILLSIVLLVFGNTVVALLSDILIVSEIWRWLQSLRHLIVAVILAVVFCSFYCLLPNNRMPWREQLPGAFVAAVFWIVYSFFFSIYIDYFNGFSMYGSLTTVIIVMIWLCYAITYGYNAYFWDNSVAKNLMFSVLCWYLFGLFVIALIIVSVSSPLISAAIE